MRFRPLLPAYVLASLVFLLMGSSLALAADLQKVGVVGSISGALTAVMPGSPTPQALKVGDDIYLDETIRAGKGASAQLMFLDKSSLTVAPDTEIKIDTFVYDPATSAGEMSVRGAKGTFRFIGGALSKQGAVTIKTPVSTIGIRGGIVQVSIAQNGGAASAIFFYGRDMSVQGPTGGISTTSEFGRGIATRSNGTTEPMKPEEVNTQLHTFNQSAQPTPESGDMNTPAVAGSTDGEPTSTEPTGTEPTGTEPTGTEPTGTEPSSDLNAPPPIDTLDPNAQTIPLDSGDPLMSVTFDASIMDTSIMDTSIMDTSIMDTSIMDTSIIDTSISPGATTGSNTVTSSTSTGSPDPHDPANWGPWASNIFIIQVQNPANPIELTTSAVTGLPLLATNLTTLPTIYQTFGTVNYGGTVDGAVQVGAGTPVPYVGTFTSQIDFNARQLNNLVINMGGFSIGTATPQASLSPIVIGGTYFNGSTYSATGSADLGLYGVNADLLAGQFSATSAAVSTTAQGALVGGK